MTEEYSKAWRWQVQSQGQAGASVSGRHSRPSSEETGGGWDWRPGTGMKTHKSWGCKGLLVRWKSGEA